MESGPSGISLWREWFIWPIYSSRCGSTVQAAPTIAILFLHHYKYTHADSPYTRVNIPGHIMRWRCFDNMQGSRRFHACPSSTASREDTLNDSIFAMTSHSPLRGLHCYGRRKLTSQSFSLEIYTCRGSRISPRHIQRSLECGMKVKRKARN